MNNIIKEKETIYDAMRIYEGWEDIYRGNM
jgi:hypothetical protein